MKHIETFIVLLYGFFLFSITDILERLIIITTYLGFINIPLAMYLVYEYYDNILHTMIIKKKFEKYIEPWEY